MIAWLFHLTIVMVDWVGSHWFPVVLTVALAGLAYQAVQIVRLIRGIKGRRS